MRCPKLILSCLAITLASFALVGCRPDGVVPQGNTKPQSRLVLESGTQRLILGEQTGDDPLHEIADEHLFGIAGGFGVRLLDTQRKDSMFIGWGELTRAPWPTIHMRTGDGLSMYCDLLSDGMLQVWQTSDSVKARFYYDKITGALGVDLVNGGKSVGVKVDKDGNIQFLPPK